REPLVPRRVDLLGRAGPGDLLAQPLPRALPGLRPRDPLRAVLVSGQAPQLLELGDGAGRVERHLATILRARRGASPADDGRGSLIRGSDYLPPGVSVTVIGL